jgi:hypothetical protein
MAQKKVRLDALQATLAALEKKRGSRIYTIIDGGVSHFCGPTIASLIHARESRHFGNIDTLEVLLHSPGGHAEIAYSAVKFFRNYCNRLHVIVPMYAKSAATLFCLGADRIFMGELAQLGPLDVQITDETEKGQRPFSPLDEFKSMEFLREYATELLDYFANRIIDRSEMSIKEALHEAIPAVIGLMTPLYSRVDASKVGGYRRALAIAEEYAKRLLVQRGVPNAEEIVGKLGWAYPSHSFIIDIEEAAGLGLPVFPLPLRQEEILLEVIDGVLEYETSIYGFVTDPPKKKAKVKRAEPVQPDTDRDEKLRAITSGKS